MDDRRSFGGSAGDRPPGEPGDRDGGGGGFGAAAAAGAAGDATWPRAAPAALETARAYFQLVLARLEAEQARARSPRSTQSSP